jgi:hypothetical protein
MAHRSDHGAIAAGSEQLEGTDMNRQLRLALDRRAHFRDGVHVDEIVI